MIQFMKQKLKQKRQCLKQRTVLKKQDVPFPTKVEGSSQPSTLTEDIVAVPGDKKINEDEVEFFIREV